MTSIGRYQLVEKLGQGGMGVVYRAFDTLLQRVVAVKVISGTIESGTEQRERFFREARAAGQLSHRNIITIHDLGEQDGQPYLAMEYLEGEDLQRRLTRPDRMSLHRKVELAIEICEGLEYAHARGVIHRDIKPANIFITDNGTAKILDFGLARLVTSELTNSNMMMGTINYMAPEQVRGERADHRSDIFSVGVVLYELLGGRKAFEGDSFATTLYRILQEEPESLLQLDPSLPPELVAIVERSLAKPRDERYQTMSDMLRDLAIYRQQMVAYDTPSGGRSPSAGFSRPSDPPRPSPPIDPEMTVAHVPTPFPPLSAAPASGPVPATSPATPVPAALATLPSASQPRPRRAMWLVAVAVAVVVVLTVAAVWIRKSSQPAVPASAPVPTATTATGSAKPDEAALSRTLRQAADELERGEYDAAERHANDVLALSPDHPDARRIRDRAATTRDSVARGLREARAHLAAGRFEEASREAGNVLGLVPAHPEARAVMQEASARSRGRGAAEARTRMTQAKNAARAAAAPSLAADAYNAAVGAERAAQRLYDSGQLADATARFYEASGLFRSAELSAQSEAAARAERAQAEKAVRERDERAAAVPSPPPPAVVPPPVTQAARNPEPPAPTPQPPSLPLSAAPVVPPAATKPSPPPEPSAESQVADLLSHYETALEARSLTALKRVWPGLGGNQEAAIRNEFEHATRISVEIVSPHVEVSGATAVATFTRRYELVTVDGQRLSSQSLTTMSCRRTAAGWVIDQVRFDPIR